MKKIGDSTATANASGEWTEGNPGAGLPATLLKADWLTTIQRELINVVLGGGLALNPNDDTQLFKAIQAIQTAASTWAKLGGKPTTVAGFGLLDVFTKTETGAAIQTAISALVASSPAALDTLKELATALGNDPNFATTMATALGERVKTSELKNAFGLGDSVFVTNLNNAAIGFFYSPPEAANSPGLGICVGETRGSIGTAARTQTCIDVSTGTAFKRVYTGGTWGSWGSDLVPQATEAFLGGATIATQGQVNEGVNDSTFVTPKKLKVAITALVNGSPAALDTLKELATALGNDPNFATSMATALGERVKTSELKDAFGLGNSALVTNLNNAPVGFFYSAPGATNNPGPGICVGETRGSDGTGSKTQWCIDVSDASMYKRVYLGGTWRAWDKLLGGSVAVSDLNGAPFGFFFAASGATNSPPNSVGILHGHTYANAGTASGGQVCMDVSGGAMYKRVYTGSSWSAWDKIIDSSNQFGGASQAWQNVSASRTVNVTYTNNTGNPISVAATLVNAAGGSGYFQVGGVKVSQLGTSSGGAVTSSIFVVVPPGATYGTVSTSSIAYWSELR